MLIHYTLASRYLSEPRHVTVFKPDSAGILGKMPTLLVADGYFVTDFAASLTDSKTASANPQVAMVGIHASSARVEEYIPGVDVNRFAAHEAFVISEVVPWAEETLQLDRQRENVGIFGVSNGALFAIAMGLRHPAIFGSVIAFSIPGGACARHRPAEFNQPLLPRFYLSAGTHELPFARATRKFGLALEKHGVEHRVGEHHGGHELCSWCDALPVAIDWCWGRQ